MRPRDVSMPLFEGMPAFPGDPPFRAEPVNRLQRGDAYNLSRLTLGSHAGTHVDPPSHFVPEGTTTERLALEPLNGPCVVVAGGEDHRTVSARELGAVPPDTARVLLKTPNSARWSEKLEFFPDYVGLSLEGARQLATQGVRLVGIDSLSIESDPEGRFPVHRELLGRGVTILEGLLLDGVRPGPYELTCLPLALRGGDGGPARAVLWAR